MKKIAKLLIDRRYIILSIMLVVTVACGILATTVPINKDRTKYLADDSPMKQGLAVMESAFPETKTESAIRVMFDDLTADQIPEIKAALEAIPNVTGVAYEAGDEKYNKENHTLFVVSTDFEYKSDEERAIERAIEDGFSKYKMVYHNNDLPVTELPLEIIVSAIVLAVIILIVMSPSWLDPFLFLIALGVAIVINFGTNAILPYIDEMTLTVGPILQMVLSMDYSIILMSRYRQEKERCGNKLDAMKEALAGAISSIASSSMTTVVGLLALVFLSFKIGPEMGIVLAKGVFISMICVFTVLPVLILLSDKWLDKTKKKPLHVPTKILAKISYKIRYAMPAVFAILFIASFILQGFTAITFADDGDDDVAHVFPKDNTIVLVYKNEDEDRLGGIISELEKNDRIFSILGYANTLGKEMSADEMSEAIGALGGDISIGKDVIKMLYFIAADGETPKMTASEFMSFITESVLPNETFSEYLDQSIIENVEYFEKLSDKDKLTSPMTAEEMAEFFGIESESIEKLYLLHGIENGVQDSGSMTLSTFVNFVLDTVAKDELYGAMLDPDAVAALEDMRTFTDAEGVQAERTVSEIAEMIGMDDSLVRMVFVLHNAGDTADRTLTVSEFSAFLHDNIMNDVMLGEHFDDETREQIKTLNELVKIASEAEKLSASEVAKVLGIDEESVTGLYYLYSANDPAFMQKVAKTRMTLSDFLDLLMANAPADQQASLEQLVGLVEIAESGRELDTAEMSGILGFSRDEAAGLYYLYFADDAEFVKETRQVKMPLVDFLALVRANAPADQQASLEQIGALVESAVSGEKLDVVSMARLTGTNPMLVSLVYHLAYTETMSVPDFLYVVESLSPNNSELAMARSIVELAVSGEALSSATLATTFGIAEPDVMKIFGLALASEKTVALADFTEFLVESVITDADYSGKFTSEQVAQLRQMNKIVGLAASGDKLVPAALADTLGLTEEQAGQLIGLELAKSERITLADFTDFLVSEVIADEAYASAFTPEQAAQLRQMNEIVGLAASGESVDATRLAGIFGMDTEMIGTVLRLYFGADIDGKTMSLAELVDFLLSDSTVKQELDVETIGQLGLVQSIVHSSVDGRCFTSAELAALLGMDSSQAEQLYIIYMSEYGTLPEMSPESFVDFIVNNVLENESLAGEIDASLTGELRLGHILIEAVVSGMAYTAEEMCALLSPMTDAVSQDDVDLLYLYYGGISDDADRRMTIPALFDFIADEMLKDARFDAIFDEDMRTTVSNSRGDLNDAIAQMQGDDYSRLVITSDYADESDETYAYVAALHALCDENFDEYYLIGNSVMVSEMDETFDSEYLMITLITAIAIFLVVLFAFRKPTLPLILTLIVQCGVFITVTVIGAYSGGMYYLALLIVQSILMGATIDYGIVFCDFYHKARAEKGVTDALREAYDGSMHTIMTSGSILVLVLATIGIFTTSAMISEVCISLSIGVFIAILLILFVLPGTVVCFDRLIAGKKSRMKETK